MVLAKIARLRLALDEKLGDLVGTGWVVYVRRFRSHREAVRYLADWHFQNVGGYGVDLWFPQSTVEAVAGGQKGGETLAGWLEDEVEEEEPCGRDTRQAQGSAAK